MAKEDFKETRLSKIRKGEYFRFKGSKKVFIFNGGGKVKGFRYYAFDDISDERTTKTDRIIEINFYF